MLASAPVMLQLGGESVRGTAGIRPVLPTGTWGDLGGLPCACEQRCLVLAQRAPLLGTITHRLAARRGMSPPSATGHWTVGCDGQWGDFGLPWMAGATVGLAVGMKGSTVPCLPPCLVSELLMQADNLGVPLAVEAVPGGVSRSITSSPSATEQAECWQGQPRRDAPWAQPCALPRAGSTSPSGKGQALGMEPWAAEPPARPW